MKDSYSFYKDKLNQEYRRAFEQVELYVLTQNVDESIREERLSDLLDIFFSAQEAGKPVQSIIGINIERFCKTFCSDFGAKNRILNILDRMKSIAWILIVISILDILAAVFEGNMDFLQMLSINVSVYIVAVIFIGALAALGNSIFCHTMFKTKRVSMRSFTVFTIIGAVVSCVIIFLALNAFDEELFNPPLWTVAASSCIYLAVYYPLLGKRLKRPKVKLFESVQDDILINLEPEMMKKFDKAKAKQLRQNKGELSFAQFLELEEKECIRTEKIKWLYMILPIAVAAVAYAVISLTDSFESAFDGIFFIAVILLVEIPIMMGLWKLVKTGIQTRRAWIAKKRRSPEDTEPL